MEDDDEFGDLYTDVLRPLQTSLPSQTAPPQSRPIDLKNSFSDSNSSMGIKLNASIQKTLSESGARPGTGGFDLDLNSNLGISRIAGGDGTGFGGKGLEKGEGVKLTGKGSGGVDFMEDEDDLNILVEERDNKGDGLVDKLTDLKSKKENVSSSAERDAHFMSQTAVREMDAEEMIPGLSGKLENRGDSNFEDEWESDESEDDLQIVLNDNHGPMGMERMAGVDDEDDEDGEPLVIVAGNGDTNHQLQQLTMDEQEWVGEEGASGAEGEKRELGDAAKASGGGMAPPAAAQPKLGYSNHMYHQPFHPYKYVRPGVPPIPGAAPATPGGIQCQVRPPISMGAIAGRGRGDWRPGGIKGAAPMQKGFNTGYGMPVWGANAGGRGYGSGLDFTLPSHKTIFEVDIDGFEEKPWKLPGIDVSDFFNFGLNEESWKDYCKQLEQLRLATTMQSKIRVYESGRAEQDYDPDLPPELAAAVGIQDISSENANPGKTDNGPTDLARASARGRPPVPIGRPIPVETGSGDRVPSAETRRQRMHDSDAIIEIFCHDTTDDQDMEGKPDNDSAGEDLGGDGVDDRQFDDTEHGDNFPHAYSGRKDNVARSEFHKSTISGSESEKDDNLHAASEARHESDEEVGIPRKERTSRGRDFVKSPKVKASDNDVEHIVDDQNESFASEDRRKNPPLLSSCAVGSDEGQAVADGNEESVKDDGNFDIERDETAVDATTSDALEEGISTYSSKKEKISSRVELLSQENDDGEETLRSSENSKARSGSSKDQRKFHDSYEDEVLQDMHHPSRRSNTRRPVGEEDNASRKGHHEREETGRHHMAERRREDSRSRRGEDPNSSSLSRHMKSESADRRKESGISDGSWRRRDEDLHGRRARVEDTRKKEHTGEIGSRNRGKVRESERSEKDEHHQIRNQLDSDSWREANQDQDMVSRQRNKDDNRRTRNERADDLHDRRKKEGAPVSRDHADKEDVTYNHRESVSHRKREREDSSDMRKRDDHGKLKDDDMHYIRQKREGSIQKERGERQRDRDEWHRTKQQEETFSRREREETRPVMRSARIAEDKTWTGHSRGKDDYKVSGRDEYKVSGREYPPRDMGRHSGQVKRRERVENESSSQHRGHDDYARGNQASDDEKRARHGRPNPNDDCVAYASDTSRLHEQRQKEGSRKSKESERGDGSSLTHAKRNQDERSGQISETVNMRGRVEQGSGENDIRGNRQSSRKHGEEVLSDDEQANLRKGRSKLERWTSHKERDFTISSPSLKGSIDLDAHNNAGVSVLSKLPEEPFIKVEDKSKPSVDVQDTGDANAKAVDDKHLDTVAKLKKRSERFKLPMPSEKDVIPVKKTETEPPAPAQTEKPPESEIKSERPARKRRWTGN